MTGVSSIPLSSSLDELFGPVLGFEAILVTDKEELRQEERSEKIESSTEERLDEFDPGPDVFGTSMR